MVSSFKKWVDSHNVVLILITVYFFISIIKIEHPGVNNDQLMFINTATLNPDNMFLWKSFHGIPTMVFPYIGALKSYLYMPIFYLFGVNIWSIRLPHTIIISIALFLLYKGLTLSFNKKIAILTIFFLALDPSHIVYSKVDTGPTVIEFFLKVLTIYLFFLYLNTKKEIIFLSIYPVLLLGIFNKINFFWFVNAFMISLIILYGRTFYSNFKHLGKFVPLILIAIPYYILLRFFIKLSRETALSYKNFANEVSLENIFTNFPIFYKNLTEVINGNLFFNMAYGYNTTNFGMHFSYLILLISLVSFICLIIKKSISKLFLKSYFFIILIILLISLQVLLTRRAISAWHTLMIYPFFTIFFAVGVYSLYTIFKSAKIRLTLVFLLIFIFFYQLTINFIYISKYSTPTKSVALSSSIYDLIDYAKVNNAKFICLDVDICNQLLSFTQQTDKYKEPFSFLDPHTYQDSFARLAGNFNSPDKFLYVSHNDKNAHFPALKQNFFKYLNSNGVDFIKVKEFKDGESIVFEIYKIGYKLNNKE